MMLGSSSPSWNDTVSKTQTAPFTDPVMWKRLLARVHPDSGGSDDLFIWVRELQASIVEPNYVRSVGSYGEPYDSILSHLKGIKDTKDTRSPAPKTITLLGWKAGLTVAETDIFRQIVRDEGLSKSQVGFLLSKYMDRR
jgi:hypothetical protein